MNPFFSLASVLDWSFSIYDKPLPNDAPFISARACQSCHGHIVDQWKESRHAQAWSNPIFQEGYIAEPDPTCVYCHAPHKEQLEEVRRNKAWYEAMHPEKGSLLNLPAKYPEPQSQEGITCATCHVRSGKMIAGAENTAAMHPIIVDERLKTSEFCKDCHDFPIFERDNGVLHISTTPMQTTYQEWKNWSENGGKQQCQGCHMPDGRHEFHGANQRSLLHQSIHIDVQSANNKVLFQVVTNGVGHHVPSGDLFRHLTIDIQKEEGWEEIAYIGRKFALKWEGDRSFKRLISDTSLRPNIPQIYEYPLEKSVQWRLVYHYGSKVDEARAVLSPSVLVEVIEQGVIP